MIKQTDWKKLTIGVLHQHHLKILFSLLNINPISPIMFSYDAKGIKICTYVKILISN